MSSNLAKQLYRERMKQYTVRERIYRFWKKNWIGYAFLAPFVILFSIFTVAPVLTAIGLSFTDYNMMQTPHFVGLNNYKLLFEHH